MRIGELLLERSWVDQAGLSRAIAAQDKEKIRLCTLLVQRGLLDNDHAARALADQHGVPFALTRHLEQRDPLLAKLVPAALARQLCAVPIGRGKTGELVIAVRDPSEEVCAKLADACGLGVVVAVAPEGLLAKVVDIAYARMPSQPVRKVRAPSVVEEFEVDLNTGPVPTISDDEIPFASFNLVELDDVGVTKDFNQVSGQFPIVPRTMTPQPMPAQKRLGTDAENDLLIDAPRPASGSRPAIELPKPRPGTAPTGDVAPPRRITRELRVNLRDTLAELADATSRDDATEIAMAFVAVRWTASLMFSIKEGAALGHRGHGPNLTAAMIAAIVVPLTASSIVGAAHDAKKIVTTAGAGAIQARLTTMLGFPDTPIAAPILVAGKVASILAVGDPQGDPIGTDRTELEKLCAALGAAFARIITQAKQ